DKEGDVASAAGFALAGERDTPDVLRIGGIVDFFFQAEDGIRDLIVTGVQTCALPICRRWVLPLPPGPQRKTKRSPSSSASRSAFSAAAFFPGEKLSSVGGGGGASSSRSCCINPSRSRRAAGISIKIRGRKHVTLSATPSLDQQEADHLPRRRGGYRRGGRAGRGDQALRK